MKILPLLVLLAAPIPSATFDDIWRDRVAPQVEFEEQDPMPSDWHRPKQVKIKHHVAVKKTKPKFKCKRQHYQINGHRYWRCRR